MVIPLRIKGAFEMNGKRYLLDTNAFIQLLSGNGSVRTIIDDADFLSTSVICQAEFLAYPKLDPETRKAVVAKYAPHARLRQGENGAPSEFNSAFALNYIPWSELSQAKYDLRRALGGSRPRPRVGALLHRRHKLWAADIPGAVQQPQGVSPARLQERGDPGQTRLLRNPEHGVGVQRQPDARCGEEGLDDRSFARAL